MESKTYTAFKRLSDILDTLRQECPWDKVQTLESLRYLTIEEVHELSEAITALAQRGGHQDASRVNDLKKELGDLAMHVMFYTKIAEDEGLFRADEVYDGICNKLVARHPFIYQKEQYHGESWEQLKQREGRRDVLGGVPNTLPSLVKAIRMQEKVAGMGQAMEKEVTAPAEKLNLDDDMTSDEMGDLLFSLVDWARQHHINADDALCAANLRFRQRHSIESGEDTI